MKKLRVIAVALNKPTYTSGWCDEEFGKKIAEMMLKKGYDIVIQNKEAV